MDFNYIYDVQGNCSVIDLIKWKISDNLDWMRGIWGTFDQGLRMHVMFVQLKFLRIYRVWLRLLSNLQDLARI